MFVLEAIGLRLSHASTAFLWVPSSDRCFSPPTSHQSPVSYHRSGSITPNTRTTPKQLYIELRDSDTLPRLNDCFRSVHSGECPRPQSRQIRGHSNRYWCKELKGGGISAVTLGDTSIAVSETVKSLGVTLDETLSFNSQVDNVCKAAHFHIRALHHIRRCKRR